MKYFLRSLKYLKPYRFRLGIAVVCVICIAVLWGSGLGMLLPGAKILLSEEGLHGWAWNTVAADRLGARISQQRTTPGTQIDIAGQKVAVESVLNIVSVSSGKAADKAGLTGSMWIIGLDDGNPAHLRMRDDVLVRELARLSEGDTVKLHVYDTNTLTTRSAAVTMGGVEITTAALGRVAATIPEPEGNYGRWKIFVGLLVVVIFISLLRAVFTFIQEYLVGTAIWRGVMDMRCDNYNVVLHLPTTFFSEKGVSDATSRFIQDTNELARGQNTLLGKTLVEPAKAVASLSVALFMSWELTLLALLGGPPAFILIRKMGKRMHKASRRALESWSGMLAVLGETLQGIRVVKAYTMEGSERRRFFRVNRQLLRQQNKMEYLDAATGPTVELLGIAAGMAAAAFAGYLVFVGMDIFGRFYRMDPAYFLTWMGALFAMFDPVRKLAKVSIRFQASDAAAQRIFELQDIPREPVVKNAPALDRHHDAIVFQNVDYRYPGSTNDTLKDISLTLKAGQSVAIVGPNGSGKTTLLSLLPRLLDATGGQILIDGKDIRQVSVRSLRRQIGLVTQDTVLFHATIAENISYGLRRPRREDVLAAARQAYVDEFVQDKDRFPQGYETMVGEFGATLSGGQKQRIAIARAILRDPTILIFDEAMSQVDADSESKIQKAMDQFVRGRTTLMIAHRFATVMSAQRIVVMDNGQIADSGTHEELLKRCELYQHLFRTQFGAADGALAGSGQQG